MELIPRPLLRSALESLEVLGNSPKARRSVGGSAGFVLGVLGRGGVWRPQRGLSGGASLAGYRLWWWLRAGVRVLSVVLCI